MLSGRMRARARRGWPRTLTRTTAGTTLRHAARCARLRQRTGTPATSRSTGAGRISTTTVAVSRLLDEPDRRVGDADGHDVAHALAACRRSRPARSSPPRPAARGSPGPMTFTVAGSAVIRPTTNPGAGSPSGTGTIGTMRRDRLLELERDGRRHDLRDLDAVTARGPRRCAGGRAASRAVRAVADRAPPRPRPDRAGSACADDPRTRTSTVAGRSPTISSVRRNVAELQRHAQAALDDVLAGDGQPEQRRQRDREHLQAEMAEGVVRHLVIVGRRRRTAGAGPALAMISVLQPLAQLVGGQIALDPALERERDLPASPRRRRPRPRRSPRSGRSRRGGACRARG